MVGCYLLLAVRALLLSSVLAVGCILPDYQGVGGAGAGGSGGSPASTIDTTNTGAGGAGASGGTGGGGAPAQCPTEDFAVTLGASSSNTVIEHASIAPNGQTVLGGHFDATFTFGSGLPLLAANVYSLFVGALDAEGKGVWAHVIESSDALVLQDLLVTPTGNVVVVLTTKGALTLDQDDARPFEEQEGFVFLFDPAGELLWEHQVGGPGNQWLTSAVLTDTGRLVIGGYALGDVPIGGATSSLSTQSPFILTGTEVTGLDGGTVWPTLDEEGEADVRDVLSVDGNLYLTGYYRGDFPDFSLVTPPPTAPKAKIYIVRIGDDDFPQYARGYGSPNREDFPTRLVDAGEGAVLVAGVSLVTDPDETPPFSFSGQTFAPSADNAETFIGLVDGTTGNGLWIAHQPVVSGDPLGPQVVVSSESVRDGVVTLGHVHLDGDTFTNFDGVYRGLPDVDSVFLSYELAGGTPIGALTFGDLPTSDQRSQFKLARHDCGDLVYGRFSGTADWFGEDLVGDEGTFRAFVAFASSPLEIPSF